MQNSKSKNTYHEEQGNDRNRGEIDRSRGRQGLTNTMTGQGVQGRQTKYTHNNNKTRTRWGGPTGEITRNGWEHWQKEGNRGKNIGAWKFKTWDTRHDAKTWKSNTRNHKTKPDTRTRHKQRESRVMTPTKKREVVIRQDQVTSRHLQSVERSYSNSLQILLPLSRKITTHMCMRSEKDSIQEAYIWHLTSSIAPQPPFFFFFFLFVFLQIADCVTIQQYIWVCIMSRWSVWMEHRQLVRQAGGACRAGSWHTPYKRLHRGPHAGGALLMSWMLWLNLVTY